MTSVYREESKLENNSRKNGDSINWLLLAINKHHCRRAFKVHCTFIASYRSDVTIYVILACIHSTCQEYVW